MNGQENLKYVSVDGHYELVFNANHELQTEYNNPEDMGTYNYASPDEGMKHNTFDVEPWIDYGNTEKDPTTTSQRSGETIAGGFKMIF